MKRICLLLVSLGCITGCSRRPLPLQSTVTVRDTVVVRPAARIDTVIQTRPADTIRLVQNRLRVRVIRQRDTLRLHAECLPDTVRLPLVRMVQTPASAPPARWPWLLGGAVLMGLLLRALRW